MLPWHSLLTIYKLFVKPQIDYGDIFYDHQSNKGLCQKTVTIQRNAAPAITSTIKSTSQMKLYN